ncbi:hypothetical protein SRSM4_145 [Synechococcus phage S-RSM4]|uniref:Uncharacterized protein n=1 Tax=Synechococcus phage S-RSM4 TaxID=555387 RepID=C7BVB3_9CAUD|nr:hypothetical protein SRSM4_145 [Synechococcus phage S-RSM4]CAR63342.1 hypothetical protein SRSM4_145 [Synechococcus phage S-RSM4]
MYPGKLTVTNANPSESVMLPLHAAGAMPRAVEGSICWDPDAKRIFVYAPNSDGELIWQETQRQ